MRRHLALLSTLTFCVLTGLCLTDGIARCAEVVLEEDIAYGKVGDTELKLDLARPERDGPFPAIVFIHGGGWYQGNRQGYRGQIQEAARRGYVATTISYRLMQFDESKKETTTATPIFPAQIHDAKAAIRWVRANAKKYHVDPDRIGVTGGSAGGHLSLLVGLKPRDNSGKLVLTPNVHIDTQTASSWVPGFRVSMRVGNAISLNWPVEALLRSNISV